MKTLALNKYLEFAILRIGVAITILSKIAVEFSYTDLLYSQKGIIQAFLSEPLKVTYSVSLPDVVVFLGIQNEHLFLNVLYVLFGISAVMLLFGFKTKINAGICLFIHMIVFNGYNLLTFGFDGFLFSLLFYTLIFPVQKVFSIDRYFSKQEEEEILPETYCFYVRILQVHLCIVYFVAGYSKLGGQEWMNGTAIWSAINQPQFYTWFTPMIKSVASNPLVCTALTWGTLFVETLFPLLIWIRWGKIRMVILVGIVLMHVFIGAVMGLQLFAWIMIVFDLSAFGGIFRKESVKIRDRQPGFKAFENRYPHQLYL
jgi:hypothetical protein